MSSKKDPEEQIKSPSRKRSRRRLEGRYGVQAVWTDTLPTYPEQPLRTGMNVKYFNYGGYTPLRYSATVSFNTSQGTAKLTMSALDSEWIDLAVLAIGTNVYPYRVGTPGTTTTARMLGVNDTFYSGPTLMYDLASYGATFTATIKHKANTNNGSAIVMPVVPNTIVNTQKEIIHPKRFRGEEIKTDFN